jgi:cyanophycin synthetase
MLAQQGLTVRSIPSAGRRVRLRRRDNVNAGGSNEQVALEAIHPDNEVLALRAARILRLDIAGIDFITEDITKSWMEVGGGICEVNAQPQIGISDAPDLYHRILREAMPRLGRVPMVLHAVVPAVGGHPDRGDDAPPDDGLAVFNTTATRERVVVDGRTVSERHATAFEAIRAALNDPGVRGLIATMPINELLAAGLPARWIDRILVHRSNSLQESEMRRILDGLRSRFAGNVGEIIEAP